MANPLLHIRKIVLGLTQQEMAELTGAHQATVSRWETGELEPDRDQMKAIMNRARVLGKKVKPADFFDADTSREAAQ